uniref:Lipoprotein, putative n=1 Tax=Rheinheimera sp. BAL341 TaxID=1708203 RepID=A0A486XNF7_9GAMM
MLSSNFKSMAIVITAVATLIISGCATGPKVRTDAATDVNFAGYKTFAFMPEPATDKAGYTTLVTQHFKDAISAEMAALGYQYSDSNADLLVNFNSNVETRTDVRSTPTASVNYSYYHYRRGIYAGLPLYSNDVDTIRYKYGTVNIDVVDAAKKQLIWEGISEGTLKKSDLEDPKQAIAEVVALIFQQYPSRKTTTSP